MDELLAKLKTRLRYDGVVEDAILNQHLLLAIDVVNDRRQFISTLTDIVESRYKNIVVEMAVSSYARMGAEGQIIHSESGVTRQYETGMYPASLLRMIVPKPRNVPIPIVPEVLVYG